MNLLQGAGEVVLWCMAGVIGVAIVVIVVRDWWHQRQLFKHWNEGRR